MFDNLHKLVTIVLAIATGFLGYWQFNLQHDLNLEKQALQAQVTRSSLLDKMIVRIESYIDKQEDCDEEDTECKKNSGLSRKEKTNIFISLIKISTDAHLGNADKDTEDNQQELLRSIPFHFALLSENSDMLSTIGSNHEDITIWIKFAKASADPEVKSTAAKALERIFILTTDSNLQAKIIQHLLDLSVNWRDPEIHAPVSDALITVLKRISKEDIDDNEELAKAVKRAKENIDLLKQEQSLREQVGSEAANYVESNNPAPAVPPTSGNSESRAIIIEQTAVVPHAHTLKDIDQLYEQAQVKITKEENPDILNLIKELEEDDTKTRRSARSRLASTDQEAVPALIDALENKNEIYRIRLGVISALLFMNEPVIIENEKLQLITDLLGDQDSTVRKNTAKFLVRFLDLHSQEQTTKSDQIIGKTLDLLSSNLSQENNPNLVYNSAVVLGEFLNVAPEPFNESIRLILESTRDDLGGTRRNWQQTIMQIDNSLK